MRLRRRDASAFNVASMHDMQGGRWIVEAAPGYWRLSTGKGGDDPHGYTAGVSVKREFSPSWGAGLIASTAQQSGSINITKKSDLVQDSLFAADPGGSVKDMNGTIFGLMATHDFHPVQDSWRLPFSFGALYIVTKNGVTTHYHQDISITDAAPVLYTSFEYRPWGVSFDWNMTELLLGKNATASTIYSVKLSKKFGGS